LTALDEQCPELTLAELIHAELWRDQTISDWEGTSIELEQLLTAGDSTVREQVRKLNSFPNAIGTYLARLSMKRAEHFRKSRSTNRRGWIITKRPA
jgi:hypothetical protein